MSKRLDSYPRWNRTEISTVVPTSPSRLTSEDRFRDFSAGILNQASPLFHNVRTTTVKERGRLRRSCRLSIGTSHTPWKLFQDHTCGPGSPDNFQHRYVTRILLQTRLGKKEQQRWTHENRMWRFQVGAAERAIEVDGLRSR